MASVSPAPRFTLREAEAKLLTYEEEEAVHDVSLRRAFLQPPNMRAEDVYVQHELSMRSGKGHNNREVHAMEVAEHCVERIGRKYSCPSADEAKLLLKLYVCEFSSGNREDRIYATETGNGHIKLTLAWCLSLQDGTVVLDGGRLHEQSSHLYGLGDMIGVAKAERTIQNMANRMCDKILAQTNIPSRYNICGCAVLSD